MNRTKYILRGILLLLTVLLLIDLYRKTDDNIGRIARFKLETLNKMKADSLDTEHQFKLLVNETAKFNRQVIENSPRAKSSLRYIIGVVGLLIIFELAFYLAEKIRTGGQNIKS